MEIGKKRKPRVVHVNTIKAFVEREEIVARVTLVTEEDDFEISKAETVPIWADGYSKDKLYQLLDNYQDVLSNMPGLTHLLEMRVQIETEKPIALSAYKIPEVIKEKVKKEIENLKEAGIIRHSCSPWVSPLVHITKPDKSMRLCVDYRKLNSVTVSDPY